jgi:hypothetical protein
MRPGMLIRVLAIGMIGLLGVDLQTAAAEAAPGAPAPMTAPQLDRLVAPIALYPDPLLAQILMAATYPLEVVEADRWLQVPANAALKGDALTAALQRQKWDPSIKSLIAFPRVLRIMDDHLDWTEDLGNAFLMQQADVMEAIQRLRRLARATGSLASGPQQIVSPPEPQITIEPANPEIVYVPTYNSSCVYGAWPEPTYPPFIFGAWPDYCGPAALIFGAGIYPPLGFWRWAAFEWRRHEIRVDPARFAQFHTGHVPADGVWQHDPAHRDGVPFPSAATATRFLGAAEVTRREFRGFVPPQPSEALLAGPSVTSAGREPQPAVIRGGNVARPHLPPTPELPPAPIFQSFGSGAAARGDAVRGFSSRMSAPAPSFHAAPAPSFHAAPSFGGAGARR